MTTCPKCGCEIDDMADCCQGCLTDVKSLLSAIEGNRAGMSHRDLVLTCNMLERGRTAWQRECESEKLKVKELWQVLVMLKRELDPHETKPDKLELPKDAWSEAVRRAKAVEPEPTHSPQH